MEAILPSSYLTVASNYLNTTISTDGWVFWLLVLLFILFLLWLFFGGGDYEYVGLSPMKIGVDSTKYANEYTYAEVTKSNRNAKKVSDTPDISKVPSAKDNSIFIASNTSSQNSNSISSTSDNSTRFTEESKRKALGNYKCYKSTKISKGESLCKAVLEDIYNLPFYCVRPDFLKNPETNRNLELDLYNDELKIAVEYSGIAHYSYPNPFHRTKEQFINQVRRDKFKVDTCDLNGVYLITVPYNVPLIYDKIKDYITYYLPENYSKRTTDNPPCFVTNNYTDENESDENESDENESDENESDDNDSDDTDDEDELTVSFVSYDSSE